MTQEPGWRQGDIFYAPAGSIQRPDTVLLADAEDEAREPAVARYLDVVNASPEVFGQRTHGLVMMVSHSCDLGLKKRSAAEPLLVAPLFPLTFIGDSKAGAAWHHSWEGAVLEVLPLPACPPLFSERALVHLRFITAIRPELLGTPQARLSVRERRRLRQQLARFFTRFDLDVEALGAKEDANYPRWDDKP